MSPYRPDHVPPRRPGLIERFGVAAGHVLEAWSASAISVLVLALTVALTIGAIMRFDPSRHIPTGAMCAAECSAAGLRVHKYRPRTGYCVCTRGGNP